MTSKTLSTITGLVLAGTALTLPFAASAASLTGVGTRAIAEASGTGSLQVPVADVGSDTSAGVQASGDEGLSHEGSGVLHIDINAGAGVDASASQGSNDSNHMTGTAAIGTSGNGSVSSVSSTSVQSDADLTTFAKAELGMDSTVKSVDTTADSVSVTYNDRAHFLGVFPTTARAVATVRADGSVQVSYPWYDFLLSTHASRIRAALSDMTTHSGAQMSANGSLTANDKAQILAGMHSILSAQLSASASAAANTNLQ